MPKLSKFFLSIISFLLFLMISSCSQSKSECIDLSSGWKYSLESPLTEDVDLKLLPDSKLYHLESLFPDGTGTVYLVKNFLIPYDMQKKDISCYLGHIAYSDKTYLNHYLIGATGSAQNNFSLWNEARFYEIPEELLVPGVNTIIIEVFVKKIGFLYSDSFISYHNSARSAYVADRFWNSQIYLILAFVLLFFSFYCFRIFSVMGIKKDAVLFSLLCIVTVLNLSFIYIPEIPGFPFEAFDFYLFNKLNAYVLPAIILGLVIIFTQIFLNLQIHRKKTAVLALLPMISGIIMLFLPDELLYGYRILIPYLAFLPGFFYIICILIYSIYKSVKNSIKLTFCYAVTFFGIAFDLFFHKGMEYDFLPYITFTGWPLSLLCMTFILSHKKIDEIRSQTTSSVPLPIAPLINIVQPALPPEEKYTFEHITEFNNYEIVLCTGKDEDNLSFTFDLYKNEKLLEGVCLFESSDPEASIGFIKNVVSEEFVKCKELPLTKAMESINSRSLCEKTDNSLLYNGILIKFTDSRIEYVNVGHLPAFYRNIETGKTVPIQIKSDAYALQEQGAIGKNQISEDYKGIGFAMNSGDSVILYTKSLADCTNGEGESFSIERIQQAFYQCPKENSMESLKYVMNMFKNFTDGKYSAVSAMIIQKK